MKRQPGDSQLDVLWKNYGERETVDEMTDDLQSIPSLGLVKGLLTQDDSEVVGSIEIDGSFLVVKSKNGIEMDRVDIRNLKGGIKSFKRILNSEGFPVYSIELDNGEPLEAPIDRYIGGKTNAIHNEILDNIIYSRLQPSKDSGIEFVENEDGLSGKVKLEGDDTGVGFEITSEKEYNKLEDIKKNTIYFIKNKPYLYFNDYRIGSESEVDIKQIIKDVKAEFDEDLEKEINRATKAESKLELAIDQTNQSIESVKDYVRELKINLTDAINDKQPAGDYLSPDSLEGYVKEEEYNTLKENFEALKKWTENMFKSDADTITDIRKGGDFTLVKDIKATKDITLTKDTNLNLDGHTLSAVGGNYGDNIVIGNGANVVISNGQIPKADLGDLGYQSATIIVKTAYESHLTLNNTKVTGIYPVYLNSANENSTVTINSGEYYSSYADNPAVYVGKGSSSSTTGGKVTIYGGTFGQKGVESPYLLNVEDVLRKQEGKKPRDFIEVYGGTFYGFNPADNKAEGPGTNFVAEGYSSVSVEENVWKVVKNN